MFRFFVCALMMTMLCGCNLQTDPPPAPTLPVNNALPVSTGEQLPNLCYFSPFGIGSPFEAYDTPTDDTTQRTSVGMIEAGTLYTALSRNDLWFQVVVDAGVTGWIPYGIGELTGNCENLPTASFRPPAPEGVCTVYFDTVAPEDNLYVDQEGSEVLTPMVANEYIVVEARSMTATLRVRLNDGRTGWLLTPDQVLYYRRALNGPCDTLPVEESNVIGG